MSAKTTFTATVHSSACMFLKDQHKEWLVFGAFAFSARRSGILGLLWEEFIKLLLRCDDMDAGGGTNYGCKSWHMA